MKRCPECRRDYYDDSLLYCLDDGSALLEGPASGEAPTVIFAKTSRKGLASLSRRRVILSALMLGAIAVMGIGYMLLMPSEGETNVPSQAAHDKYLRAKVLLSSENKEDDEMAIALLEQTVEKEPQFAAAWSALARAYNIKAFYFAKPSERKKLNEDAHVAVEKALAIDPNLAEAYLARGVLLWNHTNRFQHEQAVQSYKRAVALDPKLSEGHHQLALVYLHLGLFDKARAEISKALEINPHTYARFRYGVIDQYRGRYDDAYAFFKSTPLEKNPSLHAFQTATALFKLGRNAEADAMIAQYLREYPDDEGGVGTSVKAMLLANDGKTDEAEAAIARAEEIGKDFGHFHHTAYNIASAYAILKKPDNAVDYLLRAADEGFPCYPLFDSDEAFNGMRQHPRYVALLAKLKQQWERYNTTL